MSTNYTSLEHPSSIIKDEAENCRMCLESSGEFIGLVSAFETTSAVLNFMEAYNFCTNLNAQPEDCLPKIVCIQCAENLKFVYEVIRKAVQSDQLLREFLSKQLDTDQCKNDQEFEEVQVLEDFKEDIISSDENSADNVEALIFMEEVPQELEDEDVIEPTNDYACSLCEAIFVTEEDLIQHIRTHEELTSPIEDSLQIECEETLQTDESTIEVLPPNDDTFSTPKVDKKSSATQCICEICGKCFTTKQKLKMHNLVHTNEKNFACELCPKRFKTIFRKRDHLKLHENIRTHECSFCKERFFSKHTLICHMRRHTGERPYKCEICGKSFTQSSIMKTHVAIHTGKTVECPLCFKKFSRPSHLILHQRNHTGERPYICHLCPNSYKQKSHLDRHLDTHNGVKHVCKICGKFYTKKSTLNTHMLVHAENKRFNCDICEMRFPTKYKYLRHVNNGHKVTAANGSDGTLELEENSIDDNSQPKSN